MSDLLEALMAFVAEHRRFGDLDGAGERTCLDSVLVRRNIRTAFENAVEQAKLDDFHFHDCRPTSPRGS
jgi:hypothetical protein